MICKKCGKEISDGLQFCSNCGCETGYEHKQVKTGRKIAIWSIVLAFDLTLIGLILGVIGLLRGIKTKDKLSIIMNIIGIFISITFTIIYMIKIINFINAFKTLIQQ